ncbi:transporter substrate-binding domain-containing protein [Actinosynnema sp. NPDC023587]|uniref:transporter substrate-binding domain-containing protein n=1 Tax=Actinosynnema sp. NPDC023587 TaxID=3154695 RepID=UPI0033C2EA52
MTGPQMVDTPPVENIGSFGRSVRGELLWIVPAGALSIFLGRVVLASPITEKLAPVIGLVLGVLAIVVALLIYRLQVLGGRRARDLVSAVPLPWHLLSYALSAVLLVVTVFWPIIPPSKPKDDPAAYLAKDRPLRIGINGKLPGWSDEALDGYVGFDVSLVNFLKKKYGFGDVEYVLLNQYERLHQWDGKLAASGAKPVDLVISTLSINDDRLADFDMAGPYYLDVSTIWRNGDKEERRVSGPYHGCAVNGTTGLREMDEFAGARKSNDLVVDKDDELATCVDRFFHGGTEHQFISSDWSILRAYSSGTLRDGNSGEETFDPDEPSFEATEKYGIAIPNNYPNVCRSLSEAINEFLDSTGEDGWQEAYYRNLQNLKVESGWHKPDNARMEYCG